MNAQLSKSGRAFLRVAITLTVVIAAVLATRSLWQQYMVRPWTRDGRVSAEVVNIAPDVSGRVVWLSVADNQFVHKGDLLFSIDPDSYRLALAQAQANLDRLEQDWKLKQSESNRRIKLSTKSVISTEETETAQYATATAKAAYDQGKADRDLAKLNLDRTAVYAPVNGYITNLHLRVGSYTSTAQPELSIVDSDSFWIAGYFEETQLPGIRENAPVTIRLMGVDRPLKGHVESISHGIADTNSGVSERGLANVDPVFTWVRLAQRIPVRIHIDQVPKGTRIVAGLTCTLAVGEVQKAKTITLADNATD
ncbi:MAG: efflux RND transporter periplasmic adaptor subunit [Chthoniobacteraceae bacterium]